MIEPYLAVVRVDIDSVKRVVSVVEAENEKRFSQC